MDNEFEFFYPIVTEKQIGLLDGKIYEKDVFLEGHITHGGRLLCGESREVIKNRRKTKKEKTAKTRIDKTKICIVCTEKYKKNGHSAWKAWVEGKPKVPPTKLPKLAKF